MTLARFRANPATVRVCIRRLEGGWWRASILSLVSGLGVSWVATSARKAVALALKSAAATKMPGIDLSLGYAYEHPQRPERAA